VIQRKAYLDRLIAWRDKHVIKVVTGIRRCGKSKLLELYRAYLLSSGVDKAQIVSVDLDDLDNAPLCDKIRLHAFVLASHTPGKKLYVFLDEIQNVPEFEKCLDSLYLREDLDIYITGSNAFFLSGELATFIAGRDITVEMLPLSFAEYVDFLGSRDDLGRKYRAYTTRSSFPYATQLGGDERLIDDYLQGIYNTILVKDIAQRYKFTDMMQLQSVLRFCFANIANLVSTKSIADTMTSNGRKIDVKTVEKYLSAFTGAFVLYQAKRYDVKGKQHLKTLEKYYAVDIGLRYALLGRKNADTGYILENVVYLELLRRGFAVSVGKVGDLEIDFVAVKPKQGALYIQVAASVRDRAALQRELAPLRAVNDHYPKMLLTLDDDPDGDYDGITRRNALDWLCRVDTRL
jgi:predicted AAA+ superfamily ATPase